MPDTTWTAVDDYFNAAFIPADEALDGALAATAAGGLPPIAVSAAGLVSAQLRELKETRYQFDRPFVLDSTAFTHTFGLEATPLDQALSAVADHAAVPTPAGAR